MIAVASLILGFMIKLPTRGHHLATIQLLPRSSKIVALAAGIADVRPYGLLSNLRALPRKRTWASWWFTPLPVSPLCRFIFSASIMHGQCALWLVHRTPGLYTSFRCRSSLMLTPDVPVRPPQASSHRKTNHTYSRCQKTSGDPVYSNGKSPSGRGKRSHIVDQLNDCLWLFTRTQVKEL